MIRLTGVALLAVGTAGMGLGAVAHLEGRVQDLRGLLTGFAAMSRALASRLAPLDEMLTAAAECTEDRPQRLFQFCARELERDARRSFCGLWAAALDEMPLRLEKTDLELLRSLGGVLGRYDGDSQLSALEQAAGQLERQLEEAVEQRRRLGRVYGTVGVAAGLFLAILLI